MHVTRVFLSVQRFRFELLCQVSRDFTRLGNQVDIDDQENAPHYAGASVHLESVRKRGDQIPGHA